MNPVQLLNAIRQAGISIRLDDGRILLTPSALVTPEIGVYTAHHKENLTWLLQRRLPGQPLNEVWVTPKVWDQWLWRIGAHRAPDASRMQEAA